MAISRQKREESTIHIHTQQTVCCVLSLSFRLYLLLCWITYSQIHDISRVTIAKSAPKPKQSQAKSGWVRERASERTSERERSKVQFERNIFYMCKKARCLVIKHLVGSISFWYLYNALCCTTNQNSAKKDCTLLNTLYVLRRRSSSVHCALHCTLAERDQVKSKANYQRQVKRILGNGVWIKRWKVRCVATSQTTTTF